MRKILVALLVLDLRLLQASGETQEMIRTEVLRPYHGGPPPLRVTHVSDRKSEGDKKRARSELNRKGWR